MSRPTTRAEQVRFNRLVRHFVHRFVDHELVAAGGELHQVFVTAIALLGGFGFTLTLILCARHFFLSEKLSQATRQAILASDQMTLLLLIMAATGFFVVLGWDALFTDRRDAFILGSLPIPTRVIFEAKLYAILLFFFLLVTAMQIFPAIPLPVVMFPGHMIRGIGVQAFVLTAAAGFIFFGAMALQGVLLALLSYARFRQISALLQICTLLASFGVVFLTPDLAHAVGGAVNWTYWLPSYWFLALWQGMMDQPPLLDSGLAARALWSLSAAASIAFLTFAGGYRRAMRKAVEGQEEAPAGPGPIHHALRKLLNFALLRDQRESAIFWFTWRTISRHRGHRLLLAVYIGLGLSWVLTEASNMTNSGFTARSLRPDPVTCTIPLDLAFFLLAGLRVLFTLPVELRANWMFRLTAGERPPAVESGTRKFLIFAVIVPLALLALPVYLQAWGWRNTLLHTWFYALETALLLEILMRQFHKIPFTCSWLPGQANLKVRLGVYFILFGFISSMAGVLEAGILTNFRPQPAIWFSTILLAFTAWYRWRRHQFSQEPWAITFEELPDVAVRGLNLAR
ncbi:hypothetical protein [uncultured Paludibaculum sp.]|uniref:hypothetical protein n=1 Tax=uncultured Paludibaculum sp. TaxID=1765020 RepID=UPI002AAC1697|nr:hypothetical protein [uncultured Paludibaculum sp.]